MATHQQLAAALKQHKQAIMQDWLAVARAEIPAAPQQDRLALLDSLPAFLDSMISMLDDGPGWLERAREANLGMAHGQQRFNLAGYTMRQVIAEYHLLRRVLFDTLMPSLGASREAVHIINSGVDTGIANAADTFAAAERDEDRRRMGELQGERDASMREVKEHESFVASLSHDLKNPLGAVQMAIGLLVPELSTPDQVELGQMVRRGVEEAQVLVTDLLDVYQVKSGKSLLIAPERFDLSALLRGYVAAQELRYGPRFIVEAPPAVTGYWCAKAVRRLFDNLVTNAVKYGDAAQPITVTVRQDPAATTISVHNHGRPIAAAEQTNLFEPFVRTHAATKARHEGWGLGLAIVRAAAEAHGGSVAVSSAAAVGTTFYVTLPNDARAAAPAAAQASVADKRHDDLKRD